MAQRITIMLDDDLVKKLRLKQSQIIQKSSSSASFSHVVNESLRACLKTK
ncbi:MAG: hypothetical protein HKM23_08200 [Nitrosopumilus sp.]|nr:hypothetical protein [Nitrosopumilus sp.]NNL59465.1 hypothetical protein [Nitrosopumilus sp.]